MEHDYHNCHFCGESVKDGKDPQGNRHHLSDCRPDLVAHEPGETCTWHNLETHPEGQNCYAFMDRDTRKWGTEHKHFDKDGPM